MKDDTIKKSDVIDAVKIILHRFDYREYSIGFKWAMSVIETLPSADRPQGKWEYNNGDLLGLAPFHKCGVCGSEMYTTKDTFCPNCGADMRGNTNERHDIQG